MAESSAVETQYINNVQVLQSGKEGPNILFLHNAGQVPEGMTEHIKLLAEAGVGRIIAPNIFDLIRLQQFKGNPNPDFADIVNQFLALDVLDKEQQTGIVATSFGGSVAWEYASEKPKDVDWIVAGSPTGWPLKRSLVEWMVAFAREFLLPPNPKIPKELRSRDPGSKLLLRRFRQHPGSVIQGLKLSATADQRQQLVSLQQPVDLLWGKADQYVPLEAGKLMAQTIPNSRLEIVSQFNHLWFAVEPGKLVNPAIARANGVLKR